MKSEPTPTELSVRAWVERQLAQAPPLTEARWEQIARLIRRKSGVRQYKTNPYEASLGLVLLHYNLYYFIFKVIKEASQHEVFNYGSK